MNERFLQLLQFLQFFLSLKIMNVFHFESSQNQNKNLPNFTGIELTISLFQSDSFCIYTHLHTHIRIKRHF